MTGQQIKDHIAGTNMTDGRQDHTIGYETPRTEIMRSIQKSRSAEIRTSEP